MSEQTGTGYPDLTFREFWEQRVDRSPHDVFLIHGDDRYTFQQIDESANRVANSLRVAGIGAGDRVALLLPSDLTLLHIELAIQKLGAVMVPMIYGLTAAEVAYVVGHSQPQLCITDATSFDIACAEEIPGAPSMPWYVFDAERTKAATARVVPGESLYGGAVERPPVAAINPADPMAIMYTSGSTGNPKGVVQPNRGIVAAGHAIAQRLGATSADTFFSCLPLFHAAATHMLLAPAIACGGRFTLVPTFSRNAFWDQVRDSGSTITLLMPAQLAILMTAEPDERDKDHPLRVIFSHTQPHAFMDRFGVPVAVTWAMTETSGIGVMSHPGQAVPNECIGLPMLGARVKIVGPDGAALPAGARGELCFSHPGTMIEYFHDPANTAATKQSGWVHTGDLCAMDDDGAVYFHGRLKNVIKRGGENIAGEEVESCIAEHPEVLDCVTAAVPDPIYTEEVHAVLGVRAGSALTEQDIVDWCAVRLSNWKIPRYVTLVEGPLPRLTNGKINRLQVKRDHPAEAARDGGSRAKTRTHQKGDSRR